eukprot:6780364-Karenia_brevis.AAC.1
MKPYFACAAYSATVDGLCLGFHANRSLPESRTARDSSSFRLQGCDYLPPEFVLPLPSKLCALGSLM